MFTLEEIISLLILFLGIIAIVAFTYIILIDQEDL